MWKDHIVEEVRKVRKEHASKFNFDIKAIVEDARKRQSTSMHKLIDSKTYIPGWTGNQGNKRKLKDFVVRNAKKYEQ